MSAAATRNSRPTLRTRKRSGRSTGSTGGPSSGSASRWTSPLQAPHQQPVEVEHEDEQGVGADVLQVLVPELTRPRAEVVVQALAAIDDLAQADHADDMNEADGDAGQRVNRQGAPPGVPGQRQAPVDGSDGRNDEQPHQAARHLPDHRLPGGDRQAGAADVDLRRQAVGDGIDGQQDEPEADLDGGSPRLIALVGGAGGRRHGLILVACNRGIASAWPRLAHRCGVARRRHSHRYASFSRLASAHEPSAMLTTSSSATGHQAAHRP